MRKTNSFSTFKVTISFLMVIGMLLGLTLAASAHDVTFDYNYDAANPKTVEIPVNDQGKVVFPVPDPVRRGFTFMGWFRDSGCQQEWQDEDTVTEATTLYAKWDLAVYTVTFDPDGGTIDGFEATQNVAFGDLIHNPGDPTKDGADFLGWKADEGEEPVNEGDNAENDNNNNDDLNEGDNAENDNNSNDDLNEGDNAENDNNNNDDPNEGDIQDPNNGAALAADTDNPTGKGNTENPTDGGTDAAADDYWDFDIDTMPDHNLKLTAAYYQRYKVSYDLNGGYDLDDDGVKHTTRDPEYYAENDTVQPKDAHKDKCEFMGWLVTDGGTGMAAHWDHTKDTMPARDLTFTADFECWGDDDDGHGFIEFFELDGGCFPMPRTGFPTSN